MADDTRKAGLELDVATKGTDKAAKELEGLGKTAKLLDRDLNGLGKSNPLANSFKEADAALDKLTDSIRTDLRGELAAAAQEADNIKPGSGGGGGAPAAAKFRGVAGIVGGEGLANAVGTLDDVQDAFEGLQSAAKAAPDFLGKAASALGPVGIGLAAVAGVAALAFAAAAQSIQKEAERIDQVAASRLSLAERLAEGLSTGEAQAEIEKNANRRVQIELEVARAQDEYNKFLQEQPDILGNAGDNLLKVFDSREAAYEKAVLDAQNALKGIDSDNQALREAIDSGRTSAEKAAIAEQALADVRQNETPKAIETAKQAEKEAARAVEQQAREQEKIVQQQEQNAEKAAAAQTKYSEAVASAGTQLKQAAEDINTKLGQNLADNATALFRDATDIAEKFRRDTFDQDIKAQQAERDALVDHYRDIEDITADARKSEQEAIKEGDFRALYEARIAKAEALREEQLQTQRENEDRGRALQDSRSDLLQNAQRERSDRLVNYERQNTDARLASNRELAQASVARNRALAMAGEYYNTELRQLAAFNQRRLQMNAQTQQQMLQQSQPGQIPFSTAPNQAGIPANMIPLNMINQIIG